MTNELEKRVEAIKGQMNTLFGDRSFSKEDMVEAMEEIAAEAEAKADALSSEIE